MSNEDSFALGEGTKALAVVVQSHTDRLERLEREHDRLVTVVEVQKCKLEQHGELLSRDAKCIDGLRQLVAKLVGAAYESGLSSGIERGTAIGKHVAGCAGEPHVCDQEAIAAAEGRTDRLIIERDEARAALVAAESRTVTAIADWLERCEPRLFSRRDYGTQNVDDTLFARMTRMLADALRAWRWRES